MDGAELLKSVRETYASFDTYSDAGTVESPGLPGPGIEFQTHFKRPMNFRFHWLSWHPKFGKDKPAKEATICSDGETFRGDYSSEISSCDSFSMMIAEATGVSRSSVHTIMTLLIPGALELSHSWHDMSDVKISNDELVGENNCFHIIGTNENTDDTEAWIEKDSFLVRRIKERSVISEAQSEAMRAEAQTVESVAIMRASLEKAGLSAEMIETTLSSLATAFKPLTWQDIYEYSSISVNQPIDNNIFCELNRTSL